MGGLKEYHLQKQEKRYIRMAETLGISWQELLELDYKIDANTSKDGLVYGYILQFSDTNDPAVLEKIKGLDDSLTVCLAPWVLEREPDYEYELDAISENIDPHANFLHEMSNLEQLLAIRIEKIEVMDILLRQVFISMIGTLETYLSDTFINKVTGDTHFLERFVENHPEFRKQKFSLSEIFNEHRQIEKKARSVMIETIYHKLPTVKSMYEDTFSICFPDISTLQRFVIQRHDLVHRNGKTTDGKKISISETTIIELKNAALDLVRKIEDEMKKDEIPF